MGNLCATPRADEGGSGGVLQLGGTQQKHQAAGGLASASTTAPATPSQRAQSPKQEVIGGGGKGSQSAFDQACTGSKLEALVVDYLSNEVGDGRAVYGQSSDDGSGGAKQAKEEEVDTLADEQKVRWQQGELIGAGAFGRVYLGLNLEAEVHVLKQLHHPNIVRYLGTERCLADMSLNIFLEFVPGGSIASLLAKFGSFTESVIRVYTKQILLGLEFLHTHQIMHRDIKGANILVDNSGVVKLADFGASKKIEDLVTVDSGFKSIKGTPYWMAPEVITQTGHGRQADIWSVGCTVIEMATGKPPWSQNFPVPMSAMFHIANSKAPPPLPDHLSPEARDFLLLCFNRVPKERPNASRLLHHPFLSSGMPPSSAAPPRPHAAPAPAALPPKPATPPVAPPPQQVHLPGTGFRYVPPGKPLSPVAEANSPGLGSLGPSPLGQALPGQDGRAGGAGAAKAAPPPGAHALDPQNESVALTVDSMMSSVSYNPVEEPSWLQSMAGSVEPSSVLGPDGLPPPQPVYFGKENSAPVPEPSYSSMPDVSSGLSQQLPGDEEKIMEYVREKAYRETTRLSTPFLERALTSSSSKLASPPPPSMPSSSRSPEVLTLEGGSSPADLPLRTRTGRPVRVKSEKERMSKSRQWEAELQRELEEQRQKTKTPRGLSGRS